MVEAWQRSGPRLSPQSGCSFGPRRSAGGSQPAGVVAITVSHTKWADYLMFAQLYSFMLFFIYLFIFYSHPLPHLSTHADDKTNQRLFHGSLDVGTNFIFSQTWSMLKHFCFISERHWYLLARRRPTRTQLLLPTMRKHEIDPNPSKTCSSVFLLALDWHVKSSSLT